MAVYRFSLLSGGCAPELLTDITCLPSALDVMYAGECVSEARFDDDGYICDLPDEYLEKIEDGKLDAIFVVEPPFDADRTAMALKHELVSILLVSVPRKGPDLRQHR
ncbi:MAG: hypothetical protein IT174_03350 [Acidobacteria bacterium]|nr:hypothetical protein [Acidobacteriota bacterium]